MLYFLHSLPLPVKHYECVRGKQIICTGNCSVAIEELEVGKKCVVKQKDGVIDESNKNKVRGCTNGRRS